MRCSHCGQTLDAGTERCVRCGADLTMATRIRNAAISLALALLAIAFVALITYIVLNWHDMQVWERWA